MVPSRVSTPRLCVSAAPKQMWINIGEYGPFGIEMLIRAKHLTG